MFSVAVVFMLAAIATPMLVRARASAQRTVCLASLRQIGTAIHLYMDAENAGLLPAVPSIYAARPEERERALRGELLQDLFAESLGGPSISDGEGGFHRKLPQSCPSDLRFSRVTGFSYDYHAGLYMEDPPEQRITSARARRVTHAYVDGAISRRLFEDVWSFHRDPPAGTRGTNAVRFDGSAGWSLQPYTLPF